MCALKILGVHVRISVTPFFPGCISHVPNSQMNFFDFLKSL